MTEMINILATGTLLGLSAGFAPGPLLTLVISETIRHDMKAGIKVALAPIITDLPIIILTVLMLSKLSRFGSILAGISFLGGFLVLYLGYEGIRIKGVEVNPNAANPQSLLKGIVVNATNPHPYLFWFSVGAPIIVKSFDESYIYSFVFLVSFYLILVGSKIILAALVSKSKFFLTGKVYIYTMKTLGLLLIVFAFFLFHDGLKLLGLI